jgi:hypothetical protein
MIRQELGVQAPRLRQIARAMAFRRGFQQALLGRDGGSSWPGVGVPGLDGAPILLRRNDFLDAARAIRARAANATGESWI